MDRDEEAKYPTLEPILDTKMEAREQSDLAGQLQAMLLRGYYQRLKRGTLSDTGFAALQRLLQQNGWTLDPAKLPQGLGDLLTSKVSFDGEDDEPQVVGHIKAS
jgi:hypothetical protein